MNVVNANQVDNQVIYKGKKYNIFFTYANGDCELLEKNRFHLLLVPKTVIDNLPKVERS